MTRALLDEPVNRYKKLKRGAPAPVLNRGAATLAAFGRMLDARRPDIRNDDPEIQQMIAAEEDPCARTAMRYMVNTVAFAREVLQVEPEGPRQIILLCNRAVGKPTIYTGRFRRAV